MHIVGPVLASFAGIVRRRPWSSAALALAVLTVASAVWLRAGPLPDGLLDRRDGASTLVVDRRGVPLYEALSGDGTRNVALDAAHLPAALVAAGGATGLAPAVCVLEPVARGAVFALSPCGAGVLPVALAPGGCGDGLVACVGPAALGATVSGDGLVACGGPCGVWADATCWESAPGVAGAENP